NVCAPEMPLAMTWGSSVDIGGACRRLTSSACARLTSKHCSGRRAKSSVAEGTWRRTASVLHQVRQAAGDQRRGVGQGQQRIEPRRYGEVAGFPLRLKLLLEMAQSLEIIELLASAEHQRAKQLSQWRTSTQLQAGQR